MFRIRFVNLLPLLVALHGTTFAQSSAGTSVVDLEQLVEHTSAEVRAADTQAYDALNVPAMRAGQSFSDPVTGVRTVKVTDSRTPQGGDGNWVVFYSTLGLQISQPWGPNWDQYTLIFHSPTGSPHLVDYQLGGTTSNYRAAPAGEGRTSFARTPGNERILYVQTGSQLRRYDTASDSYADTGRFPYSWRTLSNGQAWLTVNKDETWATAVQSLNSATATALNLRTGAVQTRVFPGLNELAIGSGDVAWVIAGQQKVWNLDSNTIEDVNLPPRAPRLSHTATLDGFIHYFDYAAGGGIWPAYRIFDDNSRTGFPAIEGYWSDTHSSGHWWDVPSGKDPYSLQSHSGSPRSSDTASWEFGLIFVNTRTSAKRVLGHHYSIKPSGIPGAASSYYDESHATISNDGKIVLFTSTMNRRSRRDVFLMEVPRSDSELDLPAVARPKAPILNAVE